jgi:hypothetical protein
VIPGNRFEGGHHGRRCRRLRSNGRRFRLIFPIARYEMIAPDFMDRKARTAHLIPAATEPRWREEWPGEPDTPPVPGNRTRRRAETLFGVQGLALTSPGSTDGIPYRRSCGET